MQSNCQVSFRYRDWWFTPKTLIFVLKQDHLKDIAAGTKPRKGGGGNHLLHNSKNSSGRSPGKLWVTSLEYEGLFIWMELIFSMLFIFHLGNYLILQETPGGKIRLFFVSFSPRKTQGCSASSTSALLTDTINGAEGFSSGQKGLIFLVPVCPSPPLFLESSSFDISGCFYHLLPLICHYLKNSLHFKSEALLHTLAGFNRLATTQKGGEKKREKI